MVPIRKNLVPPEGYSLKCPYPMKHTRIVVHNTGNDASAQNEVAYMVRNDSEMAFHAAVDDVEIVQGIPFERNAWACGDGSGQGNREGIHIEICYSASGGKAGGFFPGALLSPGKNPVDNSAIRPYNTITRPGPEFLKNTKDVTYHDTARRKTRAELAD